MGLLGALHKKHPGRMVGDEAGKGWGIPRCSVQGSLWWHHWSWARLDDLWALCAEATLVGQLELKQAWAGCPVVLCAQGTLAG